LRVGILLTRGKHLHDRILSLRGKVWGLKASLSPPLFSLKCQYQVRKESGHVFVLGVSILPPSTTLIFDFGTVPTVWYFVFYILS